VVAGKAAGITLLMLGLGGIGALAMAKGLTPHALSAPGSSARNPAPSAGWGAAQASLGGEPSAALAASASASNSPPIDGPPPPTGLTQDGKVILNQASADELCKLPGVGRKRAEAILALRHKLGRFKRASDLLRIRGVGPKRLKQMLPHLVVDPPPAPASSAPAPIASAAPSPAPSASAAPSPAPSATASSAPASSASAPSVPAPIASASPDPHAAK
jgi:competence protein ComEA